MNGIRYLEKPPLPYWIDGRRSIASSARNVFATHLPNALALLGCAWLAWLWARRAWGPRAGLYAGLGVLTSIGPFLFTRFAIPEALLSLSAADCALLPAHRLRVAAARCAFYWDVGGAGAGGADQGPDRAHLLCSARPFHC